MIRNCHDYMDMFIKNGKFLQGFWHFLHLLQNSPALKTCSLKNLTSDMMVKLKDGSWRVLQNNSLTYLWKTFTFLNSFIMVTFISKTHFGSVGQESVSKLIHSLKQDQPLLIIIPKFFVDFLMFDIEKSFFAAFFSSWWKRPSDTFSICLIREQLCCISIAFLIYLNYRNSKNLVSIFSLYFYVLLIPTNVFHFHMKS